MSISKLRRTISMIVAGLAVLVLLVGCGSTGAPAAGGAAPTTSGGAPPASAKASKPSSYDIGAVLPLTGANASVGKAFQSGMETAIQEVKDAGGIDGVQITAKYLDNAADYTNASISAMNQLQSLGYQATVMSTSSGVLATAPMATKFKMLMLNPGGASPALIGLSPYLFTNVTTIREEADVLLPYLRNQGKQRIVVYGQNDALGTAARDYVKPVWEKLGGTFLGAELEDMATVDHAALIAKLKTQNPDSLFMVASGRQAGTFVVQAHELGLQLQIASYDALESGGFFPVAGKDAEGIITAKSAAALSDSNPASTKYKAAFAKVAAGQDLNNNYSILAHDGMIAYIEAIKWVNQKGVAYSGDSLREAIATIKTFKGAGGEFTYKPDGSSSSAITLSKVQGEQFVPFQTVAAPSQ